MFDAEELARLRAKYGDHSNGVIHDPERARVAAAFIDANGTRAAPGSGQRVRAVIQPKNQDAGAKPATAPAGPPLKGAPVLSNPRQETSQ